MKKKTVVMLLALSLTLAGCGSTEATNAEAPAAQNQEQTQQEEVQTQEQQMSELSDMAEETQQAETGIQASAIETDEGEFDMNVLVDIIGDGEIVYYTTPKKTNYDVQNVEKIDRQEKVLLRPINIIDPETYMRVGVMGGGTKKIHEIGTTDGGLTLIETEQGDFLVDTENLSEYSYNSETESLLTQEKFLEYLEEEVQKYNVTMSDTKEGFELLKSRFRFVRLETTRTNDNRVSNLCSEVYYNGYKEIYFDIIEETSTQFYVDVYYN